MLDIVKDNKEIFNVSNGKVNFIFFKRGADQGKFVIDYKDEKNSQYSLQKCFSCINFHENGGDGLKTCKSSEFSFENEVLEINDPFGEGLKMVFSPISKSDLMISFKIQFKIYKENNFLLVKLINIKDGNSQPLRVHSISPLTIENGDLRLSGTDFLTDLHNISWFKNGWQSWSPCKTLFGKEKDKINPPLKVARRVVDNQDYCIKGRFYSEYCTVITDLNSKNSLILGFISMRDQFSRIVLDYNKPDKLKLLTAFGCMDGVKFSESNIDSSEELFICFKRNNLGYYGLIEYAKVVKKNIMEPRITEVPIGWCSWYLYFTKITQEEMVKNLEVFKEFKDHLPIDFIQLDDGYQADIGDYDIINEKFSNGLDWLFEKITVAGYKGGIWTAPFFAAKTSEFYKKHENWFLRKKGSKRLIKATLNWGHFQHPIDLTIKEVREYIKDLFVGLSFAFNEDHEKKGKRLIDFFKIDFLHAAVPYDGNYAEKTLTRAQLYYLGVKAIRDAITDESFLLGCGAPLGPCIGVVDAMRIGTDTAPVWKTIDKIGEKLNFAAPSLKRALLPVLYRSFMHKYFWINDPDCLMIRRVDTKLTLDEIQLQITLFGLSGGQLLISDDMSKLSQEEINDAKLVIPPYNPEFDPIPSDILYSKNPTIYMLETFEIIGKRYLIALINWEDKPRSKQTSISEMIPNLPEDEKRFYVYEFWEDKFLGEFTMDDTFLVNKINPHSCKYYSIIPIIDNVEQKPVLISSSLHITQGCCEITKFDYSEGKINVVIDLIGKREGNIYLKLPKNKKISSHDFEFSLVDENNNVWKLYIEFLDSISIEIRIA